MDSTQVKLAIAPIGWTNDDIPELGGDIPFEQCISEMALAGYTGSDFEFVELQNISGAVLDLRGVRWAVQQTIPGESLFALDFVDAQLGYGREAYQQDYQTRQQQLDANRLYSQQAFDQDLASRQAAISNYLNYGREGFQQGLSQQQLALQEAQIQEQLMQNRYGLVNPGETYATVDAALS